MQWLFRRYRHGVGVPLSPTEMVIPVTTLGTANGVPASPIGVDTPDITCPTANGVPAKDTEVDIPDLISGEFLKNPGETPLRRGFFCLVTASAPFLG